MKPAHIFIFLLVLFTFGIIFYSLQKSSTSTQQSALDQINNLTPTLPPFNMQTPLQQSQPQGQQQPQQQQASQQEQLKAALEEIKQASITATIKTSKGNITMELYGADAPITVYNFVQRAKGKFFDNLNFHRVEDWVIQGGDPKGDGTGGGSIPTEFNQRPYVVGSVGAARAGDPKIQNDSQFFITKTEASHLDGQYTNFGLVTSGMEVAEKIAIGDKIMSITITQN